MDILKIEKLISLVENANITEVEVKDGEHSIRISRNSFTANNIENKIVNEKLSSKKLNIEKSNLRKIKSPMVGTFYKSSSPGKKPFVSVGQNVKKGDVLCIIEAMKIMNRIESEKDGIIAEISAKDGLPVEFDQTLFIIK